MAQQLCVLTVLAEDRGAVPSTPAGHFPTNWSCSSRGPDSLVWPPWVAVYARHTRTIHTSCDTEDRTQPQEDTGTLPRATGILQTL